MKGFKRHSNSCMCWLLIGLSASSLMAQTQTDSTGVKTEVIDVVKSYSPSIVLRPKSKQSVLDFSDLSSQPPLFDYVHESLSLRPSNLPSDMRDAPLILEPNGSLPPNYLRLYMGTSQSSGLSGFVTKKFGSSSALVIGLDQQQLNGAINDVQGITDYGESALTAKWRSKTGRRPYEVAMSLNRKAIHWYGVPDTLNLSQMPAMDFGQVYHSGTLSHHLGTDAGWFNGLTSELSVFSDAYGVDQFKLSAAPKATFQKNKSRIDLSGNISYLNLRQSLEDASISVTDYQALNTDLSAAMTLQWQGLNVIAGGRFWVHGSKTSNEIRFFPEATLQYPLIKKWLNLNLGFSGDYSQYDVQGLTNKNSFIAPGVELNPRINRQILSFDLTGAINQQWHYSAGMKYRNFQNEAYFVRRSWTGVLGQYPYDVGNSFSINYSDGSELSVKGQISGRLNQQWQLALEASVIHNQPADLSDAWNVPGFTLVGSGSYQFGPEFMITGQFIGYGSRSDLLTINDQTTQLRVPGFIDAQLHLNYAMSDNFSASLSGINLLNQSNGLWGNYPIQGIRIDLGLQYNFNWP